MSLLEDKVLIKEAGHRLTKSRALLLSIFHENPNKHFTVTEILDILKDTESKNIATTYNNLATFEELGIIDVFNFKNQKHYELANSLHGHFICADCGDIFNVDVPGLSCLKFEINQKYDAKVFTNNLEFTGLCKICCKKEEDNG